MLETETIKKRHSVIDAISSSLNDVVLVYDLEMRVVDVNPAFTKWFGFSPIHLFAKDLQVIFDLKTPQGADVEYFNSPSAKALSGIKVKSERFLVCFKNRSVEVSCSAFPVYNNDQITNVISIWNEIDADSKNEKQPFLKSFYCATFELIENILLKNKNYRTIAQQVLELVAYAAKCDSAAVSYVFDKYYEVENIWGFNEDIKGMRVPKTKENHANLALKNKKLFIVEEALTDPSVNNELLLYWGIRSVVVIPLYTKYNDIGVIYLNYYKKVNFDQDLTNFLSLISSLLSLTFENNELFNSYQRELQIKEEKEFKLIKVNNLLTALSHCSAAMVEAKTEPEFIKQVCNIIVSKSKQALAWVGFQSLRPEIWAGPAGKYINDILQENLILFDEPSKRAIFNHRPIIYNDISLLEKYKSYAQKAVEYNLYSHIFLPLIFQNEVVGVLCIYSFEKNAYTEDEIMLFSELAKHLSQGIMTFRAESAKKEAEMQLHESIEKFEFLTHKSNALVCEIDLEGNIVYENEKFQEIISGDLALIEQFKIVAIQKLITNSNLQKEFSLIDLGGYERWFNCFNSSFINKKGQTHYSLVLYDVTRAKKTESQLRQNAEDLKNLNATKDKFFSIIAHDLKNPFTCLIGASELLTMDSKMLEMDTVKRLGVILHETSIKGFALLQNLLEWARSQTGTIAFNPELIDLNELIEKCNEDVFASIISKKITIKHHKLKNALLWADKNMIRTVMRNLISNAVKYSYVGGIVEISSFKNQFGIVVKIKDFGIGISEENIQKLFRIDTNFTLKGTLKEEGTGLGLILCKEFVEKHKGKIKVESVFSKGCIFSVCLPLPH